MAGVCLLVFDKTLGLFIALAFGLAGLPWSFWIFRKDERFSFFDKAALGYIFGLFLVPAVFMAEKMVGVLYSPNLIAINWLAVAISGLAILAKDLASKDASGKASSLDLQKTLGPFVPKDGWFGILSIFLIALSLFMITLSASGVPIFELDPYYYAEGVHQVLTIGYNPPADASAWYPNLISGHLGQPIYKYTLASWYSLYAGTAPYDPYVLVMSSSIYPPIMGVLSVIAAFLLFRTIFNSRVGILVAGALAFMPTMLIKFQGGDVQIEPTNVFALVFFFFTLSWALRTPSKRSLALLAIGYGFVIMGSNLDVLMQFCLSAFLFLQGVAYALRPSDENKKRAAMLVQFLGVMFATQFIMGFFAYGNLDAGWIFSMLKDIAMPAAAVLAAAAFSYSLPTFDQKVMKKGLLPTFAAAAFILLVGGLIFKDAVLGLPVIKDVVYKYELFGAYVEPLYRTIAEQAAGRESYIGEFGFLASTMSVPSGVQLDFSASMLAMILNVANVVLWIFTIPLNLAYHAFVLFINYLINGNFLYIEKVPSLMTFFLFAGTALLLVRLAKEIISGKEISSYALLLLPIVVPVALLGFGKQKLVMYLGIALLLSAGAFWGEAERNVSEYLNRHDEKEKKKHGSAHTPLPAYLSLQNLRVASAFLVAAFVLLQFGLPSIMLPTSTAVPAGPDILFSTNYYSMAAPIFANSLVSRVQDDPVKALPKLQAFCASPSTRQAFGQVCNSVANWNETVSDPVRFYDSELCARSLWPNTTSPSRDVSIAIGYRCSFVSQYWLDSMQWMRTNVNQSDYVISWWDYGHWTNFFAMKNTVLRNEHASTEMIQRTAYSFLHGSEKDLRDTMRLYGSHTALFDVEIIGSGDSKDNVVLGGKYGALNYLGCAWSNRTSVNLSPGSSECELEHLWEMAYVPLTSSTQKKCTISESSGLAGVVGYSVSQSGAKPMEPKYCFAQVSILGQPRLVSYALGEKDANGDLRLKKASWRVSSNDGNTAVVTAIYTKEKIWPDEDGNLTDGWADRTTKFYDSSLYKAYFLNELEGFDLAYSSPQIRIYKMKNSYWESKN